MWVLLAVAIVVVGFALAGFCGTLVTPMAANVNVVPAALLELKDTYGPIKAQIPLPSRCGSATWPSCTRSRSRTDPRAGKHDGTGD